jgi:hypothetical protein
MHKINILDAGGKSPTKVKIIKINDNLFEIGLRKGLIEKCKDGYYFVGDYEELIAFKNKQQNKSFEWLD